MRRREMRRPVFPMPWARQSLYIKNLPRLSSLHQLSLVHQLECAANNDEATRTVLLQQIGETKDPKKIAPAKYALAQLYLRQQNVRSCLAIVLRYPHDFAGFQRQLWRRLLHRRRGSERAMRHDDDS